MEDPLSTDTTSNFSSIAGVPDHLDTEYAPLREVFRTHSSELPDHRSAESNSEAMIRALKALQDKIRALELERSATADKFHHLAVETQRHSRGATVDSGVQMETPLQTTSTHTTPQTYSAPFSPGANDVRGRLESLDTRFMMQARELGNMRERLQLADSSRRERDQQQRELQDQLHFHHTLQPPAHTTAFESEETEEKLRRLEAEQAKLSTVHSATESKVRDLERRLREEQRHHTKTEDTMRFPSATQARQTHSGTVESTQQGMGRKAPVKKRKKRPVSCTCGNAGRPGLESACHCRPVPGVHYRMNLKDVPFVVGTSTAPSHSVSANYQRVLSLMKSHSPLLCGAAAASQGKRPGRGARRPVATTGPTLAELRALLAGLEEEFGHLTFEHQELASQLQGQSLSSPPATSHLERQLQRLIEHLEEKAEQIRIVRKQIKSRSRKSQTKSSSAKSTALLSVQQNGQVQVTTTVTARGHPQSGKGDECKTPSLEFLKKMRSLQSTLQRDDLVWD